MHCKGPATDLIAEEGVCQEDANWEGNRHPAVGWR